MLQDNATHELTPEERKGLRAAGLSAIIYLALNIILGKGLNIFEGRLRKSER